MASKNGTQTGQAPTAVKEENQVLTALGDMQKNFMGAINGVRQDLGKLGRRMDVVESEVKALKGGQPDPGLKTRVVHQQAPTPQATAPAPQPTAMPAPQPAAVDAASDIGPEGIIRGTNCYQVGVTKCRSGNYNHCWKLLLRIRGFDRPVTIVGWNGPLELVGMMGEVLHEQGISLDSFDEGTFAQKYAERLAEDGKAAPPIIKVFDANFKVDWYKTKPNGLGHTYVKAIRVYF